MGFMEFVTRPFFAKLCAANLHRLFFLLATISCTQLISGCAADFRANSEVASSSGTVAGQAAATKSASAFSAGAPMWSNQYVCYLANSPHTATQDRDVYVQEIRRRNASCLDAGTSEASKEQKRLEAEKLQRQKDEKIRIAEVQRLQAESRAVLVTGNDVGTMLATEGASAYSAGAPMWSNQFVCYLANAPHTSAQDREIYVQEISRRDARCDGASSTPAQVPEVAKSNSLEARPDTAQLEQDRRQLAAEIVRLEAEKAQREQAKLASRISIQATATKPDADGDFVISIQTSADTASLKVDDEEQGSNKTGAYTIRRVARVGVTNTITISAKDIYGNTDIKTISVARQAVDSRPTFARLNPANVKPQPARDAVAIIIGIQNYKLIPKAEYASQDAQVFYDYASRALGIKQENIKLLLDDEADVSGILTAFQNWLPLKVRKGKTDVYVFYSGHGLPSPDGKSLFFLPVGANKDFVAKTAISQQEIVAGLKAAQPKSVTMFIDSCYSGQIRTGETLLASARPVVLTVQETAYPPDFTVITASASDQIASSSPDLKHGIFSYYLMKGLEGDADENKDGTITIGKLQSYLAERVPRFAMTMSRKQEPQLTGDANRVLVAR
jgi:hypothetical protein